MNDVTTFLVATAAIFAAVTVLLVLLSHLESRWVEHDTESGPPRAAQKPQVRGQTSD